jgi:hypothetical protein
MGRRVVGAGPETDPGGKNRGCVSPLGNQMAISPAVEGMGTVTGRDRHCWKKTRVLSDNTLPQDPSGSGQ